MPDPWPAERRARRRTDRLSWPWRQWLVAVVILLGSAGVAVSMERAQDASDAVLEQRFAVRAAGSASFLGTYAEQTMDRQEWLARRNLGGADLTQFEETVAGFGFQAAVLLDARGRALAVEPAAPTLLAADLGARFTHLAEAVSGRRAVSGVVLSAAERRPVVAFAVPYATPLGRRVLSGAYLVEDMPLRAYLNGSSPIRGFRAWIVDAAGQVVTSTGEPRTGIVSLAVEDPAVAEAVRANRESAVAGARLVTRHVIAGTGWVLVTAAPRAEIIPSTTQRSALEYSVLAVLTVIALLAAWLWQRLVRQRRWLRSANSRLEDLAHRDELTGLPNRRRIDELLRRALADPGAGSSHSVLLVDIDHFKRINDTYGHPAGDAVLRIVAGRIAEAVREDDHVGRWGGEEFLVLLPDTTSDAAARVAARIREGVHADTVEVGAGAEGIQVAVSVGCHSVAGGTPAEVLVAVADRALYRAKAAGRNQVVVA